MRKIFRLGPIRKPHFPLPLGEGQGEGPVETLSSPFTPALSPKGSGD